MPTERGHRPLSSSVLRGLALGAGIATVTAARRWLDVVEVQGGSMAPALLPGEWLVIERRSFAHRAPRVGEIVLAADPRAADRELIKRVAAVDPVARTAELRGDAPDASTDSRSFGPVPLDAISWRVAVRYWPPGRVGPVPGPSSA
jgi:nickel-type superoxide dismutase maturation protease